ncbi:MAG: hypothetical protein IKB85_06655 [Bacteroidales bacterium]|nr:hypothetical protein [Bacteroidales bacterium]
MKTRSFFMLSLAVMAMSCAKEVLPENNPEENVELKLVPMEFTTALETKAGIVDGEGTVEWAANDQITVFDNLGGKNTFTTAVGGATSVFTGEVTEGATAFYALYPQRTSTASVLLDPENEVINSKLFPNQTAVRGSYAKGNGGAVMVAKADAENRLYFKNMTSHIRFTLAEDMTDVKSITLMGNNYEILAGTYKVDFSGAEPVLTVDKPETYVTLSNGDGPLAPGDYFFTILPVEFEAGFTVILSKTDGTQVAKKTTKEITSLGTRNKVLPMAALPSSEYKSHMNYFVKYNDGFDITFGGYTFNNKTQTGAVRLTPTSKSITKDGFYFVPSSVAATIDYNSLASLIVIGEDAEKPKVTQTKSPQPKDKADGVLIFANLDYATDKRIEPKGAFSKIIFDGCNVSHNNGFFMNMNGIAAKLVDFVIKDCDVQLGTASTNFVTGNTANTQIDNVTFDNNVFYVKEGVTMTGFRLLNDGSSMANTVKYKNVTMSYNTFDKTEINGQMIVTAIASENVNVNFNVFLENNTSNGLKYILKTVPTNLSVKNNFFYKGTGTKGVQMYSGNDNSLFPKESAKDPRPDNWDPAAGICYLNSITYGEYTYSAGAQREVVASPETANYAAANYVSVDYGTL